MIVFPIRFELNILFIMMTSAHCDSIRTRRSAAASYPFIRVHRDLHTYGDVYSHTLVDTNIDLYTYK